MSENRNKIFAVYTPDLPGRHVFGDLKDAKKLCSSPASRFKICASQEEVDEFYNLVKDVKPINDVNKVIEPKTPYSEPKGPMLSKFRIVIEKLENDRFDELVEENPRYLVNTSGEKPTILHNGIRHNALHVACIKGNLYVASQVLKLVCSPEFMTNAFGSDIGIEDKCTHFLDLFLNLPDKNTHQTPLHLASKNGHPDIVKLLMGYKQLVKEPLNKYDENPADLAASGLRGASELEKRRCAKLIVKYLKSTMYYIAFYRLVGEVGRPQHVIFDEKPPPDLYDIPEADLKRCLRSQIVNVKGFEQGIHTVKHFERDNIGPSGDFIGTFANVSVNGSLLNNDSSPASGSSMGRRKVMREFYLSCFMGPFVGEEDCHECFLKWKESKINLCLTRPLDGYERVGKELANEYKVQFVNLQNETEEDIEAGDEFYDANDHFVDQPGLSGITDQKPMVNEEKLEEQKENIAQGNMDVEAPQDDNDIFYDAPANQDLDDLADIFGTKCHLHSPLSNGN
ncbi:unnamed protein product [Bursaphelenchus okinawaensis]|uniref:ANK_REP_REGION domain-containing protein n=1 Tax=Bursaphelenchus okinawaensis TaxID=465554 RepID=A0A811LKZ3_9BILA|nr:unnamed protein product [Bursaphelenchus okinawaensis]CAG9123414.1 unnamed protein product [Bursaphelenchus okinawaensis]